MGVPLTRVCELRGQYYLPDYSTTRTCIKSIKTVYFIGIISQKQI